jgi:AraC family transcriptional regulator, positive regulator of tynA and feaB
LAPGSTGYTRKAPHDDSDFTEIWITTRHVSENWRFGPQKDLVEDFTATSEPQSPQKTESMMLQGGEFLSMPKLDYESWRDALRAKWGRYNPEAMELKTFIGRARPRRLCGLVAMDLGCNAHRVVRTQRDVRLDGMDHYFVVFQVVGGSTIIQNDRAVQLAVGDAALVDSARPGTYVSESRCAKWFSLQLPRKSLVSHLGFTPQGGTLSRGGTAAGRVLFDLVRDAGAGDASAFSPAESYMQLAVYDLIGALFAPFDPGSASRETEKVFTRIREVVRERFADPDLGPCDVAAEAGISLRYMQKLFMERGATCCEFIYSLRLDEAALLLHRRMALGTRQPLAEIAYACGFRDYTHFARRFRRRFGYGPRAHSLPERAPLWI